MKNSIEGIHPGLRPARVAILSLALALPMFSSPLVAAEEPGRDRADKDFRDTAARPGTTSLRFSAARPTDRSMTVTWADLDLNRPAGLDQLYRRLARATISVCGPREHIRNIAGNRNRNACMETAMESAVRHVGHRGLEQLHAARTGASPGPRQETASR